MLLNIDLATDFMNNNLNEKMRNTPQISPWISSLRGIDAYGWKCEYEGERVREFMPNLCFVCMSLWYHTRLLLKLTIISGLPTILILNRR